MKKYILNLSSTEIVKLMSACNSAIVQEEETLRHLSDASDTIKTNTKISIDLFYSLKQKIRKAIIDQSGSF